VAPAEFGTILFDAFFNFIYIPLAWWGDASYFETVEFCRAVKTGSWVGLAEFCASRKTGESHPASGAGRQNQPTQKRRVAPPS